MQNSSELHVEKLISGKVAGFLHGNSLDKQLLHMYMLTLLNRF